MIVKVRYKWSDMVKPVLCSRLFGDKFGLVVLTLDTRKTTTLAVITV